MPKNTAERIIDKRPSSGGYTFIGGSSGAIGVTDHGSLTGLGDDDHLQYLTPTRGDARYVPLARNVLGGSGLTGGGSLAGDVTLALANTAAGNGLTYTAGVLAVGAGLGITVNADDVALASSVAGNGLTYAAGVLAVGAGLGITVNADDVQLASSVAGNGLTYNSGVLNVGVANTGGATGLTVEADQIRLTSSSGPGAAAAILSTDATGLLTLVQLTGTTKVRAPLFDTASGAMTLQPATDLILSPTSNLVKLPVGKSLQSDNYASRVTGMRVTYGGDADFRNLYTDELHAKGFVADLEQALAGGQIIAKSVAVLAVDFTAPAAGGTATLRVKDLPSAPDMAAFVSGDFVRLRNFARSAGSLAITDCWGVVTAYADQGDGTQTWTFTRSTGGNAGGMATSAVVTANSIVLDYGTTGTGFYEVNAIDGAYGANSPYSQIVTWATHPMTQTVRARLGNLVGIFGAGNEYGLYAGSGTATTNQYLRISSGGVQLNNVPLSLYNSGTQTVNIDSAGTNIWIGPSSADKRLTWNGTTLTVKGAIVVQAGSSGLSNLGDLDDLSDGTSYAKVNATIISGGNIRVGSGTKDASLNGWQIDSSEIVGQASGVDQVVLNTSGGITFGHGYGKLDRTGMSLTATTYYDAGAAIKWYDGASVIGYISGHGTDALPKMIVVSSTSYLVMTGFSGAAALQLGNGAVTTTGATFTFNGAAVWHTDNLANPAKTDAANTFTNTITINMSNPLFKLSNSGTAGVGQATYSDTYLMTNAASRIATRMVTSFTDIEDTTKTSRLIIQTYNNNSFLSVLAVAGNKVGIGTTTPAYQLDVVGAFNLSGAATFGSTVTATSYVQATDFRVGSGTGYLRVGSTSALSWTATGVNVTGELGTGWTQLGSYAARYKRFGDVVIIQGSVTATGTGSFTAGTLASGYRPANTVYLSVLNANKHAQIITINTDGTVVFDAHEASIAVSLDNISFSTTPLS